MEGIRSQSLYRIGNFDEWQIDTAPESIAADRSYLIVNDDFLEHTVLENVAGKRRHLIGNRERGKPGAVETACSERLDRSRNFQTRQFDTVLHKRLRQSGDLCIQFGQVQRLEIGASVEYIGAQRSDRFGNLHFCERRAVLENIISDLRYIVRDLKFFQCRAAREDIVREFGDLGRQREIHLGQVRAISEQICSQSLDGSGNLEGFQPRPLEQIIRKSGDCRALFKRNGLQRRAL